MNRKPFRCAVVAASVAGAAALAALIAASAAVSHYKAEIRGR